MDFKIPYQAVPYFKDGEWVLVDPVKLKTEVQNKLNNLRTEKMQHTITCTHCKTTVLATGNSISSLSLTVEGCGYCPCPPHYDCKGNLVRQGDKVLFISSGTRKQLLTGRVIGGKKLIKIEFHNGRWMDLAFKTSKQIFKVES